MNDFKRELYEELQRDAPFTEAMKNRMLRTKAPQKKKTYRPVVAIAGILAIAFLFILINPSPPPYTVASLPTDYEELLKLLKENEVVLPFVPAEDDQQVYRVDYKHFHSEQLKDFWNFPLIIEEKSSYHIGDYILLGEKGYHSATQIVAVAGNQVDVKAHQVYVDGQPLALPGMIVLDIDRTENASDVEKDLAQYVEHTSTYPSIPLSATSFQVGKGEIAVKMDQQIEVKRLADIVGEIVAIQEVKSTLVLTEHEQALYEGLKDKGLDVLKGAEPMTIAKLYIKTMLEQEFDLNYMLTSQHKNYMQLTEEEHHQQFTTHSLTKEEFQQRIASFYNGVEEAIVSEDGTGETHISYDSPIGLRLVMKLRPNTEGIWQVGMIETQ